MYYIFSRNTIKLLTAIGRIESNIEASMGNMAKHFEEGNGIDGKQSRIISKAFVSQNPLF